MKFLFFLTQKNKNTKLVFMIYLTFSEILSMADEKEISICENKYMFHVGHNYMK
jgi:hypothetical protein